MATACPCQHEFALAHARLRNARPTSQVTVLVPCKPQRYAATTAQARF
jgi:hypothetical protein